MRLTTTPAYGTGQAPTVRPREERGGLDNQRRVAVGCATSGTPVGGTLSGRRVVITASLLVLALAGAPAAGGQQTSDVHSPAALAITVEQLRGCLALLSGGDRRLVSLRFGTAGKPAASRAAVAAQLHTSAAAVATAEVLAVRRLVNAHRRGHCQGAAQRPATPNAAGRTATGAAGAPATMTRTRAVAAGAGSKTSWTKPSVLIPLVIAAIALLLLVRELRREFRLTIRGAPDR